MRIALAQINPTIGDFAGNVAKHHRYIAEAVDAGADLVVFPEASVIGYPPKDLLLRKSFIEANVRAAEQVASAALKITAIFGFIDRNPADFGKPLLNAAAVARDGRIASRHYKSLLPTYDVFDEVRYFEPWAGDPKQNVVNVCGKKLGITICEDLWNDSRFIDRPLYARNPVNEVVSAGAEIVINISAAPFTGEKPRYRYDLFSKTAKAIARPIIVVNQSGAQDELIFDGSSMVIDAKGNLLAQVPEFAEKVTIVDLDNSQPILPNFKSEMESICDALVLGLCDVVRKLKVPQVAVLATECNESRVIRKLLTLANIRIGESYLTFLSWNKTQIALGEIFNVPGDVAPLGDLTTTRVAALSKLLGLTKDVSSAEQQQLDRTIEAYIERGEIHDARVVERIEKSEVMRRRLPLIFKLTPRSFGGGWQIPLARHLD